MVRPIQSRSMLSKAIRDSLILWNGSPIRDLMRSPVVNFGILHSECELQSKDGWDITWSVTIVQANEQSAPQDHWRMPH